MAGALYRSFDGYRYGTIWQVKPGIGCLSGYERIVWVIYKMSAPLRI